MNYIKKRDLLEGAFEKLGFINTFEKIQEDDTIIYAATQDLYQSQCNVYLDIDDSIFSSVTIFFATIENMSKKEKILKLINDLNVNYRSSKYFLNDDAIAVQITYIAESKYFDAVRFMELIHIAYQTLKEKDYPKFMKIIWS